MRKLLLAIFSIFAFLNSNSAIAQCSGVPAAGTISASPTGGCHTVTSVMNLVGASSGFGIVYQWEVSPDGISYNPISGATNTTYTAIVPVSAYYRVIVTCQASGFGTNTPAVLIQADTTAVIAGPHTVCAGYAVNLVTPSPGTWASSNTAVGSINTTTGVVTGITPGTTNITYTTPYGCVTVHNMTVNALPPAISGTPQVCVSYATLLTNASGGGTWSSSVPAVGSVASTSGNVTGVSAGTTDITYTAVNGCINHVLVTVNPLPSAIVGVASVCENYTTTLINSSPGGVWSSQNTAIGSINPLNGITTGVHSGTTNISYTLAPSGCYTIRVLTVNPSPTAIGGNANVCLGTATTLSNSISGGTWSSSNPGIATVGASSGIVSGSVLGTAYITYTHPLSGCAAVTMVTVQPLPFPYTVTGGGHYCISGSGVNVGLTGSQIGVSYALWMGPTAVGTIPGTGSPLNFGLIAPAGTYTATAINAVTGCKRDMIGSATVFVDPFVTPAVTITTPTGDSTCPGLSVTFTPVIVHGGLAPTYFWTVNGTAVSSSPTYTYLPANGDVVRIKLTSNDYCVSPDTAIGTMTMNVMNYETPSVTISVNPGDTVCKSYPVIYTAAPVWGGAAPTYEWRVNGSVAGSGQVFSYLPNDGDVVFTNMTSNYLCRAVNTVASGNVNMHVVPLTIPNVTIAGRPGLTVMEGSPDTLIATAVDAGPDPKYQWRLNGIDIPGATNSVYISIFHNMDSVVCEVTSSGFCNNITTFDWVFIKTSNAGVQHFAFGDADIRVMPNPSNGNFTVRGELATSNDEPLTLELTDMLGRIILTREVVATNGRLYAAVDLGGTVANGMYILNVRSATGQKAFHLAIEQ